MGRASETHHCPYQLRASPGEALRQAARWTIDLDQPQLCRTPTRSVHVQSGILLPWCLIDVALGRVQLSDSELTGFTEAVDASQALLAKKATTPAASEQAARK